MILSAPSPALCVFCVHHSPFGFQNNRITLRQSAFRSCLLAFPFPTIGSLFGTTSRFTIRRCFQAPEHQRENVRSASRTSAQLYLYSVSSALKPKRTECCATMLATKPTNPPRLHTALDRQQRKHFAIPSSNHPIRGGWKRRERPRAIIHLSAFFHASNKIYINFINKTNF